MDKAFSHIVKQLISEMSCQIYCFLVENLKTHFVFYALNVQSYKISDEKTMDIQQSLMVCHILSYSSK